MKNTHRKHQYRSQLSTHQSSFFLISLFRYVETLMGRRRFLTKIMAGNSKEKAKAQRQAVNSICQVIEHCLTYFRCLIFLCLWLICTCFQGSAADIIKVAMIRVHSVITNRTSEVDSTDEVTRIFSEIGGKCHLILQVFYDADMILIFLDFFFVCLAPTYG